MKIGVNLVQYVDVQGIEVFARNLLGALKNITDYELVFFVNEKSRDVFATDGVDAIVIPLRSHSKFSRICAQQIYLPRLLRKNKISALLCPSLAVPLWYKNKVVVLHDCAWRHFKEEAGVFSRIYLWLATLSIKYRSLGAVAVSDFSKNEFRNLCGICSRAVMYEGPPYLPVVSDADYKTAQKKFDFLLSRKPYLFFVGNFHYRKNIKYVIAAFEKFFRMHSDYLLICAGKTQGYEYNQILHATEQYNLTNQVRFVGFVDDIEKAILYKNAAAFIFPSLYEGFGLPVLEAQSLGVPVLTSQTSSLPEIAGDGAIFIDPTSVDAIYRGMELIVSDSVLRDNLIKKGYTNLHRFSWERSARILDDFLHTLDFS